MKVKFEEYEGFFGIALEAETMAEAAGLVRCGMNHTEIRSVGAYALESGKFELSIVFGKSRRHSPTVPKRK